MTGSVPVAFEDTELGQQHAHCLIAKLVKQIHTGTHIFPCCCRLRSSRTGLVGALLYVIATAPAWRSCWFVHVIQVGHKIQDKRFQCV